VYLTSRYKTLAEEHEDCKKVLDHIRIIINKDNINNIKIKPIKIEIL
jgi:hypothetical protein